MLKELLLRSRSYRSFDQSFRIDRKTLLELIDHARLAPSSINLQMLKFRPVTDEGECAALLASTKWAGKIKDQTLPPTGHAPTAYIVICADTEVIASAASFQKDVGICAQTIMLAAAERNLGGCMIGSFSQDVLRRDLKLADRFVPMLVLALGKPDEVIELTDLPADGDTSYYRENGVHFVPKRALEDVVIE